MKRVSAVLLMGVLILGALFSQGAKDGRVYSIPMEKSVNVAALKGPTAMGLVKLMEDSNNGAIDGVNYSFTLEGAPDAIVPLLVKGDVDIACIPANLAAVLFNNTNGKIKILGINTLGVLYIVQYGDEAIRSLVDLKGKVIYSAGKGSTPQYSLEALLNGYGLEIGKDVEIEWKSEHAECVAALVKTGGDGSAVSMLPQPFATSAMMQNSNIAIAVDLNDEWEELTSDPLITGVVVARSDFIEENPTLVENFLKEYKKSVDYVNSCIEGAASLIGKYGIIAENVALNAIPLCNIVLIRGKEMVSALDEYFKTLYSFNENSVGGSVPTDALYYTP